MVMTTGTSLILIAVLSGLIFICYKINQHKKWVLVAKIMTGFIFIIITITAGIYLYNLQKSKPYKMDTLGQVSTGMTPVDVTLQLGEPSIDTTNANGERMFVYSSYGNQVDYQIKFKNDSFGNEMVSTVCSENFLNEIFGIGLYDKETSIIDKLGNPSSTSINSNGLLKFISYNKWGVAFMIEKGGVKATCITDNGSISFINEYEN